VSLPVCSKAEVLSTCCVQTLYIHKTSTHCAHGLFDIALQLPGTEERLRIMYEAMKLHSISEVQLARDKVLAQQVHMPRESFSRHLRAVSLSLSLCFATSNETALPEKLHKYTIFRTL
jgi:hypothetical protein